MASVVLLAGVCVAATVTGTAIARWHAGTSEPSRPRSVGWPAGPSVPAAVRRPPRPHDAGRAASDAGALRTARGAAEALWSFDWTDPSDVAPVSLRPWVTARLWAELADSPGAPAATTAAILEHERARVVSVTATVADRARSGVGVAVSAEVVVSTDARPPTAGREYAELLVTWTAEGWRVAIIDT